MIKRLIVYIFSLASILPLSSQQAYIDSLVKQASLSESDTTKLVLYRNASRIYAEINPDSAYHYAALALQLARRMEFGLDEGSALREMGYALLNKGNYPRSLQTLLSALEILENPKSKQKVLRGRFPADDELFNRNAVPHIQRLSELAFTYQIMGVLYANSNNYVKALEYHLMAKQKAEESGNIPLQSIINMTSGRVYLNLKKADSALISLQQAHTLALQAGYIRYLGSVFLNTGRVYLAMHQPEKAMDYFRQALHASREQYYFRGVAACNLAIADLHKQMGHRDSTLFYLRNALQAAHDLEAPDLFLRSYTALAAFYKASGNNDSTVKYQSLIIRINDSLFSVKQVQEFQNIDFDEQQRQQQIETAKAEYRNKINIYLLLGGLAVFLVIAIILWRNSYQKKIANARLSRQKLELEKTLATLKATQNQLIQSEKMASLGELTAGIAHEIQNPLNFVNNFSEVNKELIAEMREEITKKNFEEASKISKDIEDNEAKIIFHGKRADAIVKSMLQHSRASSGKKEPTDINALADEYLRLAYHGLRAKDKSFNAKFESDFDPKIEKINVVQQDIGRVILNLINNAFYAVTEKRKSATADYEPTVTVSTKKLNGTVEIRIRDNGKGIPGPVREKIFQPFFTTKPTGEGTGLGLSLSYDIVKAHNGDLKVETQENEFTEFIIILPF